MRFNTHARAATVCSLGVFTLTAVVTNFLLGLFFSLLASPAQTGLEKNVISPTILAVMSGLSGLAMAIVFFRPILKLVRERGFPGWIPAPGPFDNKYVRVALVASETDGLWKERYAQWVPAHHLNDLMLGPIGKTLTLGNKAGERLSVSRTLAPEEEGGGDIFVVRFKVDRKVIYNLEMPAQSQGTYEESTDNDYATCYYPLAFVGCDGTNSGGWLKFGGEKRVMRILYRD
jgi:hypothetical protein